MGHWPSLSCPAAPGPPCSPVIACTVDAETPPPWRLPAVGRWLGRNPPCASRSSSKSPGTGCSWAALSTRSPRLPRPDWRITFDLAVAVPPSPSRSPVARSPWCGPGLGCTPSQHSVCPPLPDASRCAPMPRSLSVLRAGGGTAEATPPAAPAGAGAGIPSRTCRASSTSMGVGAPPDSTPMGSAVATCASSPTCRLCGCLRRLTALSPLESPGAAPPPSSPSRMILAISACTASSVLAPT